MIPIPQYPLYSATLSEMNSYQVPNNPVNPNIKIQILICYPYTFLIEVVGRICWSINYIHLVWSCP